MFKIAVLISGNGSNLQTIIDHVRSGYLNCRIEMVISDRPGVYGLERAEKYGINCHVIDRKKTNLDFSDIMLGLVAGKVDLIVMAGFLTVLTGEILEVFKNRIINIHPSLIPAFCGNGMYGIKVHQAAIDYGVKVSGCSVHFVDEKTDAGPIILQKVVKVLDTDTAEELQKRVLAKEYEALSEAIKLISEGKVKLTNRIVTINNEV